MEFMTLWITTIIASFGIKMFILAKLFKDIADEGYTIDYNRTKEINTLLDSNNQKLNTLGMLIPMCNLLMAFNTMLKYNNQRMLIVDQLRILDCLRPFTKEEEKRYNENPSWINAILISANIELSNVNEKQQFTAYKNLSNNIKIEEIEINKSAISSSTNKKQQLEQLKKQIVEKENPENEKEKILVKRK